MSETHSAPGRALRAPAPSLARALSFARCFRSGHHALIYGTYGLWRSSMRRNGTTGALAFVEPRWAHAAATEVEHLRHLREKYTPKARDGSGRLNGTGWVWREMTAQHFGGAPGGQYVAPTRGVQEPETTPPCPQHSAADMAEHGNGWNNVSVPLVEAAGDNAFRLLRAWESTSEAAGMHVIDKFYNTSGSDCTHFCTSTAPLHWSLLLMAMVRADEVFSAAPDPGGAQLEADLGRGRGAARRRRA